MKRKDDKNYSWAWNISIKRSKIYVPVGSVKHNYTFDLN